jgi:hypothetical protein
MFTKTLMTGKFILLLFLISFLSFPTFGQDSEKAKRKWGFFYMPQTTFMANRDEKKEPGLYPYWKPGKMIGTSLEFIGKQNNLEIGVNYSSQGVNFANPTPYSAPAELRYLKIPITLNFLPYKEYSIPITVSAGLQVSQLLKATIYMPHGWYLPGDDRQWFKGTIVDIVAAVGIDVPIYNNLDFTIKIRGDHSLIDPEKKDHIYNNRTYTSTGRHWYEGRSLTRNMTLGLLCGMKFNIKQLK